MVATTLARRGRLSAPDIGRHVESMTLLYAANATTISADVQLTGTILTIFWTLPALDGSQATLYIEDEDDREYYNTGLADESGTRKFTPGEAVAGTVTLRIVTATSQTANRAFTVDILYA